MEILIANSEFESKLLTDRIPLKCKKCGNTFYKPKSKLLEKIHKYEYCSNACVQRKTSTEMQELFPDVQIISMDGYSKENNYEFSYICKCGNENKKSFVEVKRSGIFCETCKNKEKIAKREQYYNWFCEEASKNNLQLLLQKKTLSK